MKKLSILCAFVLLACGLGASTAQAVPRTMLLETFTNASCVPCTGNNPLVHQFMTNYGTALALGVSPHVNWPGATDPFYLLTPTEVTGRRTYYGVNAVPWNVSDGTTIASSSAGALEVSAAEQLLADAPFEVTVTHSIVSSTVNVHVDVNAIDPVPAGNLRLHVALIETEVHYATAPGTNGERDFYNAMRRLMPDHNGTVLTIAQSELKSFDLSTPVVAQWNTANIRAIAWVQDLDTKQIYQAATSEPRPAFAFYFGTLEAADVLSLGATRSFESAIINFGTGQDTYDIHIDSNMPAEWSGSVCVGATCYPPWTTDVTAHLGTGERESLLVDITPLVTSGSGTMTVTVTSQGDPTKHWTRSFKVISGVPILCVDADGGNAFQTWYHAGLDSLHLNYGTWDRAAHGKLKSDQLSKFFIVIWDADLGYPPVTPDDMTALASYLDGGGRLFISGQDIGWSLCDVSSSDRTAASVAWYQNYLGADYVMDDTNLLTLTGVAGDPISDGLLLSITGGTGSGLQTYPEEINPRSGAVGILTYAANREAAVRYQAGAFKVVYLGFGYQAVSTVANRTLLMDRVLSWLDVDLLGVPGANGPVALAPRAAPNPFGPSTKISFVVGGPGAAQSSVIVYDVLGRQVRTLWSGVIPPGERSISWDGRTNDGSFARSGVYLARVRVGEKERSLKLFLAR